jgi:hypothetical protein
MNYSFPRELIKWIQNLNLEYSFKDIRRDLINGYFIAEIYSKYFPKKISMHSYKNSMSAKTKDDNWAQLVLIFKANGFKVNAIMIQEIKKGQMDSLIGKASSNPSLHGQVLLLPHSKANPFTEEDLQEKETRNWERVLEQFDDRQLSRLRKL